MTNEQIIEQLLKTQALLEDKISFLESASTPFYKVKDPVVIVKEPVEIKQSTKERLQLVACQTPKTEHQKMFHRVGSYQKQVMISLIHINKNKFSFDEVAEHMKAKTNGQLIRLSEALERLEEREILIFSGKAIKMSVKLKALTSFIASYKKQVRFKDQ